MLCAEEVPEFSWYMLNRPTILGDVYDFQLVAADPRWNVLPMARPRIYGLGILRNVMAWAHSPGCLVTLSHCSVPCISGIALIRPQAARLEPSPGERDKLKQYQALCPEAPDVFDLAQHPTHRPRRLLVNGPLPALTNTSRLYLTSQAAVISGTSATELQGLPTSSHTI